MWLRPRTLLLHDVVIGEERVVASGAVVTKNTPPYSLVSGVPAKIIGERPKNLKCILRRTFALFVKTEQEYKALDSGGSTTPKWYVDTKMRTEVKISMRSVSRKNELYEYVSDSNLPQTIF